MFGSRNTRSEKINIAFGIEHKIGANEVDVRRVNPALSRGESHAGVAEIERERLGTSKIYGAAMSNNRCTRDRTGNRYKREAAFCSQIERAARDIQKFAGVEGHVPANGINRYVVRSNNAAPIQEVAIRKRVETIYRNIAINLHRAFGIKEEIARAADGRGELQ